MQKRKDREIMKRKLLYFLSIVVLMIIGAIVFLKLLFKLPCGEPEKPSCVPISAVWKGACDGGAWIEFVSVKKDTIRFRIYRDWNGDLMMDADFTYKDCGNLRLTKDNWNEYVTFFDGHTLNIYKKSDDSYCQLNLIYPLFYEEER
jgi:hypothetical protein